MTYTATYSPDDNKLRLYASSRLDAETYKRVKAAGFRWAPKQDLFVAPAWSPSREDLLIDLCGEIEDEDKSLTERAEERAERFEDYSDKRGREAEQASKAVAAIADNIPLGQPILVGHHSEKRARKDAEKIENGMRKAVKLWKTSSYWTSRAAGAIRHARYKQLPKVRARRIKGLEADKRKCERNKLHAQTFLRMWRNVENGEGFSKKDGTDTTMMERAIWIANRSGYCSFSFPLEKYPRELPASQYEGPMSIWSALTDGIINAEQARDLVIPTYERGIAYNERWIAHLANRLEYERAMLAEGVSVPEEKPKREAAEVDGSTFEAMEAALKAGVKVVTVNQLFPTPAELARRVVDMAAIGDGQRVLEPSAGTGALLDPIFNGEGTAWKLGDRGQLVAIEINSDLAKALRRQYVAADILEGDFLEVKPEALGLFDRIIMNPPFVKGADIKHIEHALQFLKPGGQLVTLCANGPRQQEALRNEATHWEELPAGSFSDQGTGVNVALAVFMK